MTPVPPSAAVSTHAGGEHGGRGPVEVEAAHAAHGVRQQRQHVELAAAQRQRQPRLAQRRHARAVQRYTHTLLYPYANIIINDLTLGKR